MSKSLRPHRLQHARLPCPSPTPRACSNSYPSSQWCHPTISSSVMPFSFRLQPFPASVFSNESVLHIRWSKYWSFSFSISPFSEYSGLISFRIDFRFPLVWAPCSPWDSPESSPTPQFKSINIRHSAFFVVQLSHLYMTTGKSYLWLDGPLLSKECLCFLVGCLGLS